MDTASDLYGGVEGGATNTNVVIMNNAGEVLARASGPGINPYLEGIEKVADTIMSLFTEAKASISASRPFVSVGVCSSGFLQKEPQLALERALRSRNSGSDDGSALSHSYFIDNDCPGSVFTACGSRGGVVIIAGTGSMAQAVVEGTGPKEESGEERSGEERRGEERRGEGAIGVFGCGGWGHMFGDEGSAYDIASSGIRRIFQALDGFSSTDAPPPDVTVAHSLMLKYFKIESKDGMLDVMYKQFEKARVAGFTKELAGAAVAGDAFSLSLFHAAGHHLGCMARTLAPKFLGVDPHNKSIEDFRIVCVGSVWKSFPLFREQFIAALTSPNPQYNTVVKSFKLLHLKESSAVGAAWRSSVLAGAPINVDFEKNVDIMFEYHA